MPPEVAPGAPGQDAAAPAAPASASAALAAAPAAPVAAPATVPAWMADLDETSVGYIQNKNWNSPADVLNAYRGAEKFMRAPIAQRAVIPGPDAKPEEWNSFYNQLGRPADPTGYKIEVPAEGGNPEFAKAAAAKMHELGLPKGQGEQLAAWFNEQAAAAAAGQTAAKTQTFQQEQQALTQEWGAALQQNTAAAQTAARALALDADTISKIESALGYKATMNLFAKIGAKSGEPDFVTGRGGAFSDIPTPAQAKAKIAELRADKAWVGRYFKGDAAAKAEMTRLIGYANPEPQ